MIVTSPAHVRSMRVSCCTCRVMSCSLGSQRFLQAPTYKAQSRRRKGKSGREERSLEKIGMKNTLPNFEGLCMYVEYFSKAAL